MENIYWNEEGKYQDKVDEIQKTMPSFCKTNNKYLNLFMTATSIYHDVYNNGGGNLEDCYMEDIEGHILPFNSDLNINFNRKNKAIVTSLKNKKTLENFINKVIEIVSDKDLSYKGYTIYQNFEERLLSREEKEGFHKIVFGEEEYLEGWIKSRLDEAWGFKMVKRYEK